MSEDSYYKHLGDVAGAYDTRTTKQLYGQTRTLQNVAEILLLASQGLES